MKASMYKLAVLLTAVTVTFFTSCKKEDPGYGSSNDNSVSISRNHQDNSIDQLPVMTVFASGLNNPRGLAFGPDGNLYVAEGGTGGTNTTVGLCTQVIVPVGPYLGSTTGGRISRISPNGDRTTVTDNLPSSQTSPLIGGFVSGVADVAFVGNTLYALLAGAGCSHGVSTVPNGIVKVNADGTWSLIADLSAWQQSHPVMNPEADDFEPDGTWYSMVSVRGDLYAVEPNHGEVVKVTTNGSIKRVVDISASQGHIVPTAIGYHGNFFVGNLNTFPIVDGSSDIFKITPSGQLQVWVTGLNTVLGVAFDNRGRLLVLENTVGATFPTPGMGQVLRIDPSGNKEVIATGLSLPTGITVGPDGNIYVSNWGIGSSAGEGQIVKIKIKN